MYSPPENLPGHSRIWIYQCGSELTQAAQTAINDEARQFVESWTAHNQALHAGFEILYNRFLIIMVDEKTSGASGCSIDKLFHFIQSLEKKLDVTFLDRMKFAYLLDGRVEAVSRTEFESLFSRGTLHGDTIVFNNLIETKEELNTGWRIPLKNSWHKDLIN